MCRSDVGMKMLTMSTPASIAASTSAFRALARQQMRASSPSDATALTQRFS
ncbi:MAG: hypothetical protein A4E39_01508 [Methanoregulaceae archaeon PtaB.Bin152]|nr:MAG: hypothetical protein A4E39_01508 [Methanoregulaceae archaeon PtaB.Bin152]